MLLKVKTFIWLCGSLFLHAGSFIFHRGVWTLSLVLWDTVAWPGVEPGPLRRECGLSAIGPPGKSVRHEIFSLQRSRETFVGCRQADRHRASELVMIPTTRDGSQLRSHWSFAFLEPLEAAVSFSPICPACPGHLFWGRQPDQFGFRGQSVSPVVKTPNGGSHRVVLSLWSLGSGSTYCAVRCWTPTTGSSSTPRTTLTCCRSAQTLQSTR